MSRGGGRRRILQLTLLASVVLTAACRQEVTRYFIPSARNPRFTPAEAERAIVPFVGARCSERGDSALRRTRREGEARFALEVGNDGSVARAELTRAGGDRTLDGLFGTVVAQLAVPAPTRVSEQRRAATVRYACEGSVVRVVVE